MDVVISSVCSGVIVESRVLELVGVFEGLPGHVRTSTKTWSEGHPLLERELLACHGACFERKEKLWSSSPQELPDLRKTSICKSWPKNMSELLSELSGGRILRNSMHFSA